MIHKQINKLAVVMLLFLVIQAQALDYSAGVAFGYNNGPSSQITGMLSDFATKFPFKIRLGLGYTSLSDPGRSAEARKIFINNATNGRPEKHGWQWDIRFDFLYRVKIFKLPDTYVYGGPRYVMFTANFNYVDGNENFDVVSNHWGWGLGLTSFFRMSKKLKLFIDGGSDYFLAAPITGHDTTYDPNGDDVNPREDYTYNDADKAINQPKLTLRLLVGVTYSF